VPVLTSFRRRAHASSSSGRGRRRHPERASPWGRPRGSPGASVSSARRLSARPASVSFELASSEVPGFGAVCLARPARILDRRAGVFADLRSSARAGRLRRACRRLRSLLAADQWIAKAPLAHPIAHRSLRLYKGSREAGIVSGIREALSRSPPGREWGGLGESDSLVSPGARSGSGSSMSSTRTRRGVVRSRVLSRFVAVFDAGDFLIVAERHARFLVDGRGVMERRRPGRVSRGE